MATSTKTRDKIQEIQSHGKVIGFFVPVDTWENISDDLREDFEASMSENYKKEIKQAGKSKKTYTLEEVEKILSKKK